MAAAHNEWDQKIDKYGRVYYLNHRTKTSSWDIGILPKDWKMHVDNEGRVYFRSLRTGMTTYLDPRRAPPSLPPPKPKRTLKRHLSGGAKKLLEIHQKHLSGEITAQEKQNLKAQLISNQSETSLPLAHAVEISSADNAVSTPMDEEAMMRRAIEESIREQKESATRQKQVKDALSEEKRHLALAIEASKIKTDVDVLTKWIGYSDSTGIAIEDGVYQMHCKQANEYDDQIWRDVPRTFQEKPECNTEKWRQSLFRILHSIPCHLEVGYVQGMNFLGGVLLNSTGDEEKSFWLLVRMIKGRKYGMEGLFMDGLPRVFAAGFQVSESMKRVMPDLATHLDNITLGPTAWLPQWILTLFAKREGLIGAERLQRIWTLFFRDGWHAVINVSLTMLLMCQEKVLKMTFDQALIYLTEGIWSDLDWSQLCERCNRTQVVSDDDLELLEVAYIEVQERAAREEEEMLKQRELDLKKAEAAATALKADAHVEKVLSNAKSFFMNLVKPLLVEQRKSISEKDRQQLPISSLAKSGYDGLFGLDIGSNSPKKPQKQSPKKTAKADPKPQKPIDADWELLDDDFAEAARVVQPRSEKDSVAMQEQLIGLEVMFYLSPEGGKAINTDFFGFVWGKGERSDFSVFIVEEEKGALYLKNKATGFYVSVLKKNVCCTSKGPNSRVRLRPYSDNSICVEFLATPQKFLGIDRRTRKSRLTHSSNRESHFYLVPQ